MIKEKRQLNMLKVRRCIIILVLIILLIITCVCVKINKNKNRYKELTFLLNNEFIELSDEPILDEDGNLFITKDDVQKLFDETIYYNEAEKELITTYGSHVALLKVDEAYAEINDETIELKGKLQEKNGEVYIPLTDIASVYDLEIVYSKDSNRFIMDSINLKKVEATAIKRSNIETKKGLFGKKIDKVIIGDKLIVIEESGNYKKVRTKLGNIGFIKTKKLSEETVVREKKEIAKKDVEVYRNYSNISGIYDNITVDEKKLNVVVPTFFYLENDSKVLDKTTSTTATYSIYKNWTSENKLEMLPTFTNNESVSNNLLSYSQRTKAIISLKNYIIKYNYMGINIEFDSINDINSFYRFILELVPRFKEEDLIVAVTINNNIDKAKIENVVDYIFEE